MFKKDSKFVAGIYRPVSLTSVICKVIRDKSVEKDVGVLISNNLKPSAQKANQLVGQMARSFTYRDKVNWIRL